MTLRKLDHSETDFMREYVQEGVDLNETIEQIKERRKELAKLFNCTISQVSGAVAWKKEGEQLLLKPLILDAPEDAKVEIIELLNQGTDASESVSLSAPTESVTYSLKGGSAQEHDYDNATKNEWRKKWFQFLERTIPTADRGQKKILCLPAAKCLEIPLYIQLGFRPENITGYIKDDKNQYVEEYLKNSAKFGINAKIGDLNNMLPSDPTKYDIVNLDFEGPASNTTRKTCDNILLADEAVVIINLAARRDPYDTKKEFANLHILHEAASREADNFDSFANVIDKFSEGLTAPRAIPEYYPIANTRNLGMRRFANLIGRDRSENLLIDPTRIENVWQKMINSNPERYKSSGSEPNLVTAGRFISLSLQNVSLKILEPLLLRHGIDKTNAKKIRLLTKCMITDALFGTCFVKDFEEWKYISENGSTPYVSFFMQMKTPRRNYIDMRPSVDFFITLLEGIVEHYVSGSKLPRVDVVTDTMSPREEGWMDLSDQFACFNANKIKKISFHKLQLDIKNYNKISGIAPGWTQGSDEGPNLITVN